MRSLVILFAALTLPVLAIDKVSFGKHDRFTLEFPDSWKKPDKPQAGAVVYRERESGDASFSVSRLYVPENAKVDLHDTLKSFVTNFRKGGMTVVGDIKGQDGLIDGKDSVFAQVPVKLAQGGENFDITFFLVIMDCRDQVLVLQATLPGGGNNKVRDDCRRIIGSLHEKDPKDIRKRQEEEDQRKDGDEDSKKPAKDNDKDKPAPDPKTDPRLR